VDEGGIEVISPMTSSVWKVQVSPGDIVKEGQVLVILEAMKMEIRE
jgi:biotin carboxyl carrier protein